MAKENKSGEVVEVLEDEGPEEGEIEDDTSDEDNVKNFGISSSNVSQVNASIGAKYFQSPCSSSKDARKKKPQTHVEEKSEKCWGNTNRRRYKFYVDHDNPSRESYDRLKKSDVNSDLRGLNFHDLLSEYKTSKHENEGNTHEKENRHYGKEARLDSSRKRESVVNDILAEKAKRSRKRKHRHSPSPPSPVSSEPDGRRKKEIRTTRPRRRKKASVITHSSKESALIFAQIRASKLNSQPIEEKKAAVELINVVSEGEQAEVSQLPENDGKSLHSESENNQLEKNMDSEAVLREGDPTSLSKEPNYVSGKGSFTASDSQTAEKIEDSESKDEDDDDVLQLRMIALQSAFRAKYLARKRLGLTKKNTIRAKNSVERSSVDPILDDTEELLEAAEDLTSSPVKEPESDNMLTSLAEVPLPPDKPLIPPGSGIMQAEDLTPVDMELALTDEEDANLEPGKDNDCDVEFPTDECLHPMVRIGRNLMKTKTIPVTIGRKQHHKVRQRSSTNKQEIFRRQNLLEVMTAGNEEVDLAYLDSSFVGMEDIDMYSMGIHDSTETQYPSDYFHNLDEDHALSEASDAKSDSISAYTGQIPSLSNDNEDEDEELLRAKLLLDISKRHRKEEAVIKSAMTVAEIEEKTKPAEQIASAYLVKEVQPESTTVNSPIKVNGDSSIVRAIAVSHEKMKTKRVVERVRKGHMLLKAQAIKSAHAKQYPITTLVKGRVSKMSNRGKYQRINQIRTAISKKKLDTNIQVTVAGSNSKSKVVSQAPKQQDRIVICLGEDSDDSEDDKEKETLVPEPQMDTRGYTVAKFGNQWEIAYNQMMDPEPFVHTVYPESGPEMKVKPNSTQISSIPVDFEKSVDLFLKEVRSVQESKSKSKQPTSSTSTAKALPKKDVQRTHPVAAKLKVAMNTPQAVKPNLKSLTGITPQAVRHLPFPQQEEYRRLKMQISILEMQKKRKGELSQVPPKSDQKGNNVSSLPLSKSNQASSKGLVTESKSIVCEPKNPPSLQSDLLLKDKETREKSEKVSEESPAAVSDAGFDDNTEDENVMREQLLRSRLRKRAAAKAEASPSISMESDSIQTLSSNSNAEAGDSSKLRSAGQTSSSAAIPESNEPPEKVKSALALGSDKETVFSKENEVTSTVEPVTQESKDFEVSDAISITEKIPLAEVVTVQVLDGNASLNTKLENEKGIVGKSEVIGAKEVVVKNVSLEGKETTEKRQVANVKLDVVKKVSEGAVLSGTRVNGRETIAEKELSSSSIAGGFSGTTKRVNLHSGHQGVDSKETQLKELEKKLLSERHAALDYLRELQQLLNTMEFEGNRLREKEAAVKKLRTELSLADMSLLTQKRLMKQLALHVSSVRARVTETRHKCTLLSRACQKLGNQIKQEEIANGGERTMYRVPSGVAELVKSQLSSVLFHKKQLKKSGLPFLDMSQEFTSKGGYSMKKSGKKFVRVNQQPHSLMWAKNQLASNRTNLKVQRNSPFSPSKFVKFVPSSSSLVQSSATNKSTTGLEPVASTSTTNTVPVAKGLMTSAKPSSSTKVSPNLPVADLSTNQTATKEVHVPDSSINVVVAGSSSVAEEVSSVSRTNTSSYVLMPSDSSKKIDAEQSKLLRDYESPLTSISRTTTEKLTTDISTPSENIQLEESINLDPNVMLCPYDLRGVCQDEECTYQHQRRKGAAAKKS